jgi:large subunit ribosomal protein L21
MIVDVAFTPIGSPSAMYAVIATGGKQERVAEGQQVAVELLGVEDGAEVSFPAVLLVDGATVLATPDQLKGVTVTGRVVGESKGPKIDGFIYKRRTNQRRHYGHRQRYTTVEITKIAKG